MTTRRRTELGLLGLAAIATIFAFLLMQLGLHGTLPPWTPLFGAIAVGLPLAAHLATRWLAPDADPIILPVASLLNGLGWVMIARLDPRLALTQAGWTVAGLIAYVVTLALIRQSRGLERYRYLMGAAGVALLLLPLVPHIGQNINGARLWVKLGPVGFQPVEIAKIALVIFFASFFGEKRALLARPTARLGNFLVPDPRVAGPLIAAWGFSMLAMVAEHNVGFAMLIFVLFLSMLWVATGRIAYLALGAVLFVLGAFAGSLLLAQVNERIAVWLDPWATAASTGYQIVQAQYALASGGLTGTGLGLGHPGFVPVVQTDFIFAAFAEEMGMLGTSILVIAYMVLVGTGLRAALRARSEFATLTAAGLTAVMGFQAFFIMAGIVRLLPLTGVTLPFVAYGGSSLVANYALIAIVMRISDEGERALRS